MEREARNVFDALHRTEVRKVVNNRPSGQRLDNMEDFILLLARRERMVNPMDETQRHPQGGAFSGQVLHDKGGSPALSSNNTTQERSANF